MAILKGTPAKDIFSEIDTAIKIEEVVDKYVTISGQICNLDKDSENAIGMINTFVDPSVFAPYPKDNIKWTYSDGMIYANTTQKYTSMNFIMFRSFRDYNINIRIGKVEDSFNFNMSELTASRKIPIEDYIMMLPKRCSRIMIDFHPFKNYKNSEELYQLLEAAVKCSSQAQCFKGV